MPDRSRPAAGAARTVVVDRVVAILIFVIGAVVAFDSHRVGASWAEDGPQSGYFPFYVGLLICISSAAVLAQSWLAGKGEDPVFVQRDQLRQVMVILLPSTGYVLGVQYLGIYVASLLFIGLFMRVIGSYTWTRSAAVATAVSVISFVMFEIWFKIPLPKGPLEELLGY